MPARRGWLLASVGVAAAAGGLGWSWWRNRAAAQANAEVQALWELRFDRPEGGELVMATLRGRPLLINFWATWCPPCVKEMPELDRFAQAQAGRLHVVGLAIDSPAPVQQFLARRPVGFAIGLAGMAGTELARRLGNPAGVLPYTVLLNASGAIVQRKLGETRHADLETWAREL